MVFQLLAPRVQEAIGSAPFHEWMLPDGKPWTRFYRIGTGYLLRFPELADYEVAGADLAVSCHPAPGVTEPTSRHLYLNQVLPLVLSRQGKLVFHASCVEVAGRATVFVAESGGGKSTLAASFAAGGYRFLTDDGLVLEKAGGGFQVLPSHPSIRLWEDSQEALLAAKAAAAPPVQYTTKARFVAGEDFAFCDEPRPLARAYFLGDGSAKAIAIERIAPARAVLEWVKYSFLLDIEERPLLAAHFDQVADLADRVPCYRLDYPRTFEYLPRVKQAILQHLAEQ